MFPSIHEMGMLILAFGQLKILQMCPRLVELSFPLLSSPVSIPFKHIHIITTAIDLRVTKPTPGT